LAQWTLVILHEEIDTLSVMYYNKQRCCPWIIFSFVLLWKILKSINIV